MDSQTESSQVADTVAALKEIPTQQELIESLSKGVFEVTFDKLNGDERTMICTLDRNYMPEASREDPLSQTKIRNLEEKVIVVWDTDAGGWRSFRYNRVKSVNRLFSFVGGGNG